MDCLFCKIAAGEIPARMLYQDEQVFAFADINPQAPVHILVLPRKHVPSLAHAEECDEALLGHLLGVSAALAKKEGLVHGFRTVINSGDEGGQTVDHLHVHLLGGRSMHWPPG